MKGFIKFMLVVGAFVILAQLFKPFWIIGFIAVLVFVILLFGGAGKAFLSSNDEKEGYYAQYGKSFGTNADKHDLYIEEQIANEVMKGK
mgnify:CR=1 FL=1